MLTLFMSYTDRAPHVEWPGTRQLRHNHGGDSAKSGENANQIGRDFAFRPARMQPGPRDRPACDIVALALGVSVVRRFGSARSSRIMDGCKPSSGAWPVGSVWECILI